MGGLLRVVEAASRRRRMTGFGVHVRTSVVSYRRQPWMWTADAGLPCLLTPYGAVPQDGRNSNRGDRENACLSLPFQRIVQMSPFGGSRAQQQGTPKLGLTRDLKLE